MTRWPPVYPVSTFLFHSNAHRCALRESGIHDGMRVLEVATGSGEMFRRLVRANPNGTTYGLDLSPNMAWRTQRRVRKEFPQASAHCQAVDVRNIPFRDETFDAVVCCFLLELLSTDDVCLTIREFHRVLRRGGSLSVVLIGQNRPVFNQLYRICGSLVPAFWGRQIEQPDPRTVDGPGAAHREGSPGRPTFLSFACSDRTQIGVLTSHHGF